MNFFSREEKTTEELERCPSVLWHYREVVHAGGRNDVIEKLNAYYNGEELGLRQINMVWMGTITSGVMGGRTFAAGS